jgi:flavin-binding protein dodecin
MGILTFHAGEAGSLGQIGLVSTRWLEVDSIHSGRFVMAENVYKVIELIGTSTESWEKATAAALARASKTLRDLRVAEVVKLDVQLKNGKVEAYRSRVSVSFKYESKG